MKQNMKIFVSVVEKVMNECQRVTYFGITSLYCTLGSVTLLTASESEWNGHNKMGATDYKNFIC